MHLFLSLQESMQKFCLSFDGAVQTWARRSNLDYLSLDFNSASPSPVLKVLDGFGCCKAFCETTEMTACRGERTLIFEDL